MEELKNGMNENTAAEETAMEQRPSTKYGRTAYQQQNGNQQYQQPNWQNQNPYNQPQYNAYTPYEEAKPEVKNIFAYISMVLVGLTVIVTFAVNVMLAEAYSIGNTLEEVINATLMILEQPAVLVLSTVSDLLFWATVVLLVLDIIQLHKAGKKIIGAVLFAIFLRPAYFIWRAHLLGQKKTAAIIYAVVFYMISFAQYYVILSASMDMVMRTMY